MLLLEDVENESRGGSNTGTGGGVYDPGPGGVTDHAGARKSAAASAATDLRTEWKRRSSRAKEMLAEAVMLPSQVQTTLLYLGYITARTCRAFTLRCCAQREEMEKRKSLIQDYARLADGM